MPKTTKKKARKTSTLRRRVDEPIAEMRKGSKASPRKSSRGRKTSSRRRTGATSR